jgi:vitamin B12 transporter
MKRCFTAIALLSAFCALADTKISGKVKDNKGETLPGVNIVVVGSYDGATSNANGDYTFETSVTDSAIIKASYTGFSSQEFKIALQGKDIKLDFVLKEKINDLKAVVITAGAFEASDEKKGTVLKALDIVTTAGSNGDSYGALKTLPGAQQTNDREGLFVRGGTGAETQTFIDGTWVRNAFTATVPDLGGRGRFNPFIFKGTVFSAGGYSALYGQALSSAVILETIDLPDRASANFNVSSVGVGASYQSLSKDKKSSYGIGYNYVNLSPYFALVKQNVQFKTAPTVHQIDLNYRMKTSKTGILKFYGYINNTAIDINRGNITAMEYTNEDKHYQDRFGIKNTNLYGNLSYKEFFKGDWKLAIGASASYNKDDITLQVLQKNGTIIQDSVFYSAPPEQYIDAFNTLATTKVVLEKGLANLNTIRFGGEYMFAHDQNTLTGTYFPSALTSKLDEHFSALFAESDIYLTNDLAGKIGVRSEYSSVLEAINIAPRASMAYKLRKRGQISLAYGMFYQKPETQYLLQTRDLGYMRADHYIANYQYQPKDRLLRLEAFYKKYHDLVKTNVTYANRGIATLGKGYARGFEVFYRDKVSLKTIDFWVSYSFLDTKREFLNYPKEVQPDFAATHTANFVFKKFWTKRMFGINGTYTVATGRPFFNPNLPTADFMSERTPMYHNFSISANYIKQIKKLFTVWVLSVNNPFNFKQVYGFNYARQDLNQDNQLLGREILPSARQFVFIGMFASWGIDRTQEAIDNNL